MAHVASITSSKTFSRLRIIGELLLLLTSLEGPLSSILISEYPFDFEVSATCYDCLESDLPGLK
jgi:hypothetical protein